MKNIENSDLDLDYVITITERIEVIGTDNKMRWFVPFRQYIFCGIVTLPIACNQCGGSPISVGMSKHYKLCLDGITYYIPFFAAAVEGILRTEEQQDFNTYFENKVVDQPKDYLEEFEALTGRKINTGEAEHNGYDLWMKHCQGTPNTKIPGEK